MDTSLIRPVGAAPLRSLVWLLALGACDHTTPFTPGTYPPRTPFSTGTPARLTFNAGTDLRPEWLPSGTAFFYTEERSDLPNDERCLALLPANGGSIIGEVCAPGDAARDSQITFESPAVSAGGRMAYTRAGTILHRGTLGVDAEALLIGPLGVPGDAKRTLAVPFFSPNGYPVDNISEAQWMGESSLIVLGERVLHHICLGCSPDTVRSGLEIDRLDLTGDSATISAIPETNWASSVAVGGGDTIYYTVNNAPWVYRRVLSQNATTLLHDFGPGAIVRDVRVAAGRVAAVLGGKVRSFTDTASMSLVQQDFGGDLHLFDTVTGNETVVLLRLMFVRRPILSPDGKRVVFETYPYVVDTSRIPDGAIAAIDTIVTPTADLWSVAWP